MSSKPIDNIVLNKQNKAHLERFCIILFGIVIKSVLILMIVSLIFLMTNVEIPLLQGKFAISASILSNLAVVILLATPVIVAAGALLINLVKKDYKIAISAFILLTIIISGLVTTIAI